MMECCLAKFSDLETVCDIVGRAVEKMQKQGIDQWDELYPVYDDFKSDIENEEMYLVKNDGKIVSLFVLSKEIAPEYQDGAFEYRGDNYIVVHRLCVDPDIQGQGIGSKTVALINELAKQQSYQAIWLDAFSENPYALKMYEHNGYNCVGEVMFRKGRFYLYEKLIGHD